MTYCVELTHRVMEVESSNNPFSTRWRRRKDGGIIQSETEGLRARGANPSPIPSKQRSCPSSARQAGRQGRNPLFQCFALCRPQTDWRRPLPWGGWSASTHLNADASRKHTHRQIQKECLVWAPHGQSS